MNSPRRAMTAANGYSPLWPADWAKVTQRRIMIISDAAESRMLTALAQIGVVRSHFGPAKIFGGRSDRATMQNRTLGAHLVRRGWLGSDQFRYFVTMRRAGATVLVGAIGEIENVSQPAARPSFGYPHHHLLALIWELQCIYQQLDVSP